MLCQRLDELPLAIRARRRPHNRISLRDQLLQRIGQRLDLLKGGRDTDPRQHTLRATIDWSYQLLNPDEQSVYRALSVFAGGCTYTAAEHVAGADPDTLQSLLDKSLLGRRDDHRRPRYWMLETIREHSADQLENNGENEQVLDALLTWLTAVVGDIDEHWIDRDQIDWFNTLETERANLLRGLEWCAASGQEALGSGILIAAGEWIDSRGPYAPFIDLIKRLPCGDPRLEGRGLALRARLLSRLSRYPESDADAARARELADESGDDALAADATSMVAWNLRMTGNAEDGLHRGRRALELAEASRNTWSIAAASNVVGNGLDLVGAADQGLPLVARSAELWSPIGDQKGAMVAKTNIGAIALGSGDPRGAAAITREALELARRFGDLRYVAGNLSNLGVAMAALGDTGEARAAVSDASAARRRVARASAMPARSLHSCSP